MFRVSVWRGQGGGYLRGGVGVGAGDGGREARRGQRARGVRAVERLEQRHGLVAGRDVVAGVVRGRRRAVGPALQRADLQQRAEGRAADGAVVGLVAQRVRARVAQAQVAARQDQRVAHVAHADHALRPAVLRLLVRTRLHVTNLVLNAQQYRRFLKMLNGAVNR